MGNSEFGGESLFLHSEPHANELERGTRALVRTTSSNGVAFASTKSKLHLPGSPRAYLWGNLRVVGTALSLVMVQRARTLLLQFSDRSQSDLY